MNNEHTRVGFLGPEGTFSEEAAKRYLSARSDISFHPYGTIPDVLEAVQNAEVELGVVPVENSVEGSVNVTLDWLAHEGQLKIVGEQVVLIQQNLLGLPGSKVLDILQVSSHPQALAQCRSFLRELPGVKVVTTESTSTAAAVQHVARAGDHSLAAIGSLWAAQKYGLEVLKPAINDVTDNSTRFFAVTRADQLQRQSDVVELGRPYKTSLLITLATDQTGALVYILNMFAAVGINLTRIESRPTRRSLGSYWFFIDVEGHHEDDKVKRAIQAITIFGNEVRVLGSYPIHMFSKEK